jgi:hypothetical protein
VPAVVVQATQSVPTLPQAVSFADLSAALRQAVATDPPGNGAWVGPSPRVTRRQVVGSLTAGYQTTFAWVYQWQTPAGVAPAVVMQNAALIGLQLYQRVTDALHPGAQLGATALLLPTILGPAILAAGLARMHPGWGDVSVTAYNAATNGSLAWWADGNGASATQTRDDFPGSALLTAATRSEETADGPTTAARRPPTTQSMTQRLAGDLAPYAIGAVVIVGGLYLWSQQRS